MSSSAPRIPTCVTLPPELLRRVDRIAEADERSRSFIVARALQTFCEAIETPPAPVAPQRDAAGSSGAGNWPPAPERPHPGCVLHPPPGHAARDDGAAPVAATRAASTSSADPPLTGTYALHAATLDRQAALHADRAEDARQRRERVVQQNAEALKGLTE